MDKDLKQYLDSFKKYADKRFDRVEERLNGKIDSVEQSLSAKIDTAVEDLALIIAETVANPLQKHIEETGDYPSMRKDVALLKHDVRIIKQKLQIKT